MQAQIIQYQDRCTDSQLGRHKPLHAIDHVPPLLGFHDNAGEVNVEQNDARSILGDLCAFTAYCEAHVRMHQGGSTVASIAGHRYDLLAWEDISILQHFSLRQLCYLESSGLHSSP